MTRALFRLNLKTIAISLLTAFVVVWGGAFYSFVTFEKSVLTTLETRLQENNRQAVKNMGVWFDHHTEIVNRLASHPQMVAAVPELLNLAPTPSNLERVIDDYDLHGMFGWDIGYQELEDFYLIGESGITLATNGLNNIGAPAPFMDTPDFFKRIWAGENAFEAGFYPSEVNASESKCERKPEFFFGAPIIDATGRVIAAFALKVSPQNELFSLMAAHAFGNSGETYLVDDQGRLLSPSRFTLINSAAEGCYDGEAHLFSDLNVPTTENYIRSAAQLLAQTPGKSLSPYPDYRGIDVVGVWSTTNFYGIGVITEQDDAEAFSAIASFKNQLLLIGLVITATLSMLAFAFLKDAKARETDTQARWLFKSMNEGTIILDKNGTIVQANIGLTRILDIPMAELLGKNISFLGEKVSNAARQISLSRSKGENPTSPVSTQSVVKVGEIDKHLTFSFSPLDTSQQNDVGCIVLDVTADHEIKTNLAKAKTVAEDTLAARTAFLQMVSHELRTPLNAVLGPLSIASVSDDPEQQQDMIRIAEKSANDLIATVSAVEDFISLEANETELNLEEIDLRELLELASFEATKMTQTHCDVPVMFESGTPETLYSDSRIVSWVTKEIVANALLHADPREGEEKQVRIDVRTEQTPEGDFLSIAFSDNGQGLHSDELETALQPFTRLGQLNTSKTRGLGIGLALAKRYAEILGGSLSYQHAPAGGSTFIIMLPVSTA